MKSLIIICAIITLSGCSLLPRAHDPVMFNQLVIVDIEIGKVNCEVPNWKPALVATHQLSLYATWRKDPQADNLQGLDKHVERMNKGGSKTFCEIGKKTAAGRINAAKTAWGGR
jgi:hypothetical protein